MIDTPKTDAAMSGVASPLPCEEYWIVFARQLERDLSTTKKALELARETEQMFAGCLTRIAKAHKINSPLVLLGAAAEGENYAQALASYVEQQMKGEAQ